MEKGTKDNSGSNGSGIKTLYFKTYGRIALIFFIGFSFFLLVSSIILIFLTKPEAEVKIPYVIGKQYTDIHNTLIRKGLTPKLSFYDVYDMDNGIILSQHPESGSIVSEGSKLKLLVSRSRILVDIPNVTGMELPFAKNKLKNLHVFNRSVALMVGIVSYVPSDKHGENIVIDQSPRAGEKVTPDRRVNLLVSAGKKDAEMKMTDLAGQSIDLCYELLTAKGLIVEEEILTVQDRGKSGLIETQTPAKDAEVKKGDIIKLKVNYFPMLDRPYYCYEKIEYTIPKGEPQGLYEAYVEDDKSKRLIYSIQGKSGDRMNFVFHRTGNARVKILGNKNVIKTIKFNVEEPN